MLGYSKFLKLRPTRKILASKVSFILEDKSVNHERGKFRPGRLISQRRVRADNLDDDYGQSARFSCHGARPHDDGVDNSENPF
jgi:hypothetical protein